MEPSYQWVLFPFLERNEDTTSVIIEVMGFIIQLGTTVQGIYSMHLASICPVILYESSRNYLGGGLWCLSHCSGVSTPSPGLSHGGEQLGDLSLHHTHSSPHHSSPLSPRSPTRSRLKRGGPDTGRRRHVRFKISFANLEKVGVTEHVELARYFSPSVEGRSSHGSRRHRRRWNGQGRTGLRR